MIHYLNGTTGLCINNNNYYYVQDFYTLSDKVSDSKNLSFLCKLCPPKKLAIIKKKNENELNYELVQNLNGELWTWTIHVYLYELNFELIHERCERAQHCE